MGCKYNEDDFCVNDICPACADFCPVDSGYWELCKYFEECESYENLR